MFYRVETDIPSNRNECTALRLTYCVNTSTVSVEAVEKGNCVETGSVSVRAVGMSYRVETGIVSNRNECTALTLALSVSQR